MPDLRRTRCRSCSRHKSECGPITWGGLCADCATEHVTENVVGLATMTNPARDRWRRGMAASVGAVLLDDVREQA